MLNVADCILIDHELWLVVVAGLVCTLASYTLFSLLHRAQQQQGHQRHFWLAAAAVAMGCGVWSTHFIAMLAYQTPLSVGYDVLLTVLSAVLAIGLSAVGLWIVLQGHRAVGGAVCGAMIGAMHYTGMAAFNGAFTIEWQYSYVAASILLGVGLSAAAFWLLQRAEGIWGRMAAVNLFVLAICSLHFTAMTAVTLAYDPFAAINFYSGLARQTLAIAVAAVAVALLGLGMVGAVVDGYLADRNAQEAERLRRYVGELEATRSELQATTASLSQALEAAAASSQAKSQFLATMSHELRTPLNAVIGFSEILKSEALGPLGNPRYREYAIDIHDSGSHLLSLINDVLDFSKAEAGRLELREEPVDLGEVVADCLRLVEPGAREADIAVTADLPDGAPAMLGDARRLKQIVLNLLSNALKFTPAGGSVHVALAFGPEGATLSVADTGIGMAPQQIPVALEPFGQVDSSFSRRHEGTGLGLPLCQRFAEAHGGHISIHSVLGEGTRVTLHLPAARLRMTQAA